MLSTANKLLFRSMKHKIRSKLLIFRSKYRFFTQKTEKSFNNTGFSLKTTDLSNILRHLRVLYNPM